MTGRLHLFPFLLRSTIVWVFGGISIMLLGTALTWRFLLPKIYVCPTGATCPRSFDPTNSRYLRLTRLQTIMHYLMELGTWIAALGLAKLTSYQAWLSMHHHTGPEVEPLDRHLNAMSSSLVDTLHVIWKGPPRLFGAFILFQFAMSQLIQTIVTLSISEISIRPGPVLLEFSYPSRFSAPALEEINFNDARYRTAQRKAGNKVDEWLFTNDSTHGYPSSDFRGTFVIPDNRTVYAINSYPDGYRISGSVSCTNQSLSFLSRNGTTFITSPPFAFNFTAPLPPTDARLAAYLVSITFYNDASTPVYSSTTSRYLWASQTNGTIPYPVIFDHNQTSYSYCTHDVGMYNISVVEKAEVLGRQIIRASTPYTQLSQGLENGTNFGNETQSVLFSIGYLIDAWWGTQGNSFWRRISCQQGLLTPLDDTGGPCRVSGDTWTPTARAMIDAVVQTGTRTGNETQQIEAHRESIDSRQWWLLAIIPLVNFLMYAMSLGYTLYLIQPHDRVVKEQSLAEIFAARDNLRLEGSLGSCSGAAPVKF